jgi:hypothetical protein
LASTLYRPAIILLSSDFVGDDRQFMVSIGDLSIGRCMHEYFNQPLSSMIVERLQRYGRCTACGGPTPVQLDACQCGHIPKQGGTLEVTISDRSAEPRFDKLVAQMLDRAKSATRRLRLAAAPSTPTEAEVDLLLLWQSSMCFYCGLPFRIKQGRWSSGAITFLRLCAVVRRRLKTRCFAALAATHIRVLATRCYLAGERRVLATRKLSPLFLR